MRVVLLSKKGSKAAKIIVKETAVNKWLRKSKLKPDVVINYGFAGAKKDKLLRDFPALRSVPMLNYICGHNKKRAISIVAGSDIPVPETKDRLTTKDKLSEWILKKYHSIGGKGIRIADKRIAPSGYYFQKYVQNRRFEARVHAFSWINPKDWVIQKRVSDTGEIAWNYSNGGRFITVNNKSITIFKTLLEQSETVLSTLKMEFGAIDFIIDEQLNPYFIEINSQPGFNGLSDSIYINAFNRLTEMNKDRLLRTFNHTR